MNKIMLLGWVGHSPSEIKNSQGETAYARFSLGVKRLFSKDKEETDFFDCVAGGKIAEMCLTYMKKGSRALVIGRCEIKKWTGKDGQPKTAPQVTVESIEFIDKKTFDNTEEKKEEKQTKKTEPENDDVFDGNLPY